jgi:Acetyltransferases
MGTIHGAIGKPHVGTVRRMLSLIPVDTSVCSVRIGGEIVACGYGVAENGHVDFFDTVVKSERRGSGFGRTLMNGIIREAKKRGARFGYLQVMDNNEIAKNLYEGLGFKASYKYRYRRN